MTKPSRRSIRMAGADYAGSGTYFVTICIEDRKCVLGAIVNEKVSLNSWGQIVNEEWLQTAVLRSSVFLGPYVIMPNHIHGIVMIDNRANESSSAFSTRPLHPRVEAGSLGAIVRAFKSAVTRRIRLLNEDQTFAWQRNYYEHIIRDADDEARIIEYILNNPNRWT